MRRTRHGRQTAECKVDRAAVREYHSRGVGQNRVPPLEPLPRPPLDSAGHGSIGVCVCTEIMSITDRYISSPSRDRTSFR